MLWHALNRLKLSALPKIVEISVLRGGGNVKTQSRPGDKPCLFRRRSSCDQLFEKAALAALLSVVQRGALRRTSQTLRGIPQSRIFPLWMIHRQANEE